MRNYRKLVSYLIVLGGFLLSLMLLFIIFDLVIMPLWIHSGSICEVPSVVGKNANEGESIIIEKNLVFKKTGEQYSVQYPSNTIINQIPKAGTLVKEGRCIYITVSKGGEMVNVPYVIGLPMHTTRVMFLRNGLQLGTINYIFTDSIGVDTIISQSIRSGSRVPYGSSINLTVSKGPENMVKVPDLIGTKFDDALVILAESGLSVGIILNAASETYLNNTVISQSPKAGELVPQNTSVNLTVSR